MNAASIPQGHGMIYYDEERVRDALRWPELIATMQSALAAFSRREVQNPVRQILTVEENARYFGIMPAVASDVMGLKAVSFYPANEGTRVPTHVGVILLFKTSTGEPLAAMDGRLITEMRTAAVSAAVTNVLAPPDARVLAILGSGVQAHAHLEALSNVRSFDDVRVWSRTAEHADAFARQHGAAVSATAKRAVDGADVVVTVTSSQTPVVKGSWLKSGAHVNAVGANRATWRELDDAAMHNVLVVDSRDAAAQESGDVILSRAEVYAEAGEIFAGIKPAPDPSKTTIFKSLGLAVEDLATAKLVYETLSQTA